jgi:hypothetical protein
MLDVHPPHHPTHTWKDFFIHIATIVVGLFIAVSLEQTVEYFHNRHQREELLDQLKAEHKQSLKDAADMLAADEALLNWYAARIEALQAVASQHVPYQAPPYPASSRYNTPTDPVWKAAKANGLTSLLSQQIVIANQRRSRCSITCVWISRNASEWATPS